MVKSVALWGRSMGAATAIFYMSDKFRKQMAKVVTMGLVKDDIFYSSHRITRQGQNSMLRFRQSFSISD